MRLAYTSVWVIAVWVAELAGLESIAWSIPVRPPPSSTSPLPPIPTTPLPPVSAPPLTYEGPPPPWAARIHKLKPTQPAHQGLIALQDWPAEPDSPQTVDPDVFERALGALCQRLQPRLARSYANWILQASAEFEVDPFLIGALIYDQSGCDARFRSKHGIGLTALDGRMHQPFASRTGYLYYLWDRQARVWTKQLLPGKHLRPSSGQLRNPRGSIRLTAALLHVSRKQCPDIDAPFGSVPHRHYVSHLIWGDRVLDPSQEDEVLTARRRLLDYYHDKPPTRCGSYRDVPLTSPVDGVPRKVLSGWGDMRFRGGRRRHLGIDLFQPRGSPVYASTDGEVMFAGVSVRRRWGGRSVSLPFTRARRIGRGRLALSGYFVMIQHPAGLVSAYMHLSSYRVETGDRVKAGQLIGHSGDTGIRQSKPHLHFELRELPRDHFDPLPYFGTCFLPPEATYVGRWRQDHWYRVELARAHRRARWLERMEQARIARAQRRARWIERRTRRIARSPNSSPHNSPQGGAETTTIATKAKQPSPKLTPNSSTSPATINPLPVPSVEIAPKQ